MALEYQLLHQNGAVLPKINFKSFLEKGVFHRPLTILKQSQVG